MLSKYVFFVKVIDSENVLQFNFQSYSSLWNFIKILWKFYSWSFRQLPFMPTGEYERSYPSFVAINHLN